LRRFHFGVFHEDKRQGIGTLVYKRDPRKRACWLGEWRNNQQHGIHANIQYDGEYVFHKFVEDVDHGITTNLEVMESAFSRSYFSMFSSFIPELEEKRILSDVSLTINGKEDEKLMPVPTHKFLLAAVSPLFLKMFASEVKSPIIVSIKNYESLALFVKFLYTGKLGINSNNFSDISYLANYYKIQILKKYTDLFLTSGITVDNALSVFAQHGVGIRFLAKHPELLKKSEFFQLSKDRIIELI